MLLSDSTCKHVNKIRGMDIYSIPGANIHIIHQFIKENSALFQKYTHLLLHVGTNDIGNGLSSNLIVQYYNNLFELVHTYCPKIKIVISAILPRPVDFEKTKNIVIDTNKFLASSSLKRNALFVKTYKPFVQQPGSLFKKKCFCKDGLHLSYLGVSLLRNFFIGVINHL